MYHLAQKPVCSGTSRSPTWPAYWALHTAGNCDFGIRQSPGTAGVGYNMLELGFCPRGLCYRDTPRLFITPVHGARSHSADPSAFINSAPSPHCNLKICASSAPCNALQEPNQDQEGKPSSPALTHLSSAQLLNPPFSYLGNFSKSSGGEKGFWSTPGRVVLIQPPWTLHSFLPWEPHPQSSASTWQGLYTFWSPRAPWRDEFPTWKHNSNIYGLSSRAPQEHLQGTCC